MVSCHSSDTHHQDFDFLAKVHGALPVQYNGCAPPNCLEGSLVEGRGTSKMLYLTLKLQVTRRLVKSKSPLRADLVMVIEMLSEFEV